MEAVLNTRPVELVADRLVEARLEVAALDAVFAGSRQNGYYRQDRDRLVSQIRRLQRAYDMGYEYISEDGGVFYTAPLDTMTEYGRIWFASDDVESEEI